jgi:spermidine synthase
MCIRDRISHPALYTHTNPERVLIIGGGDCGTLREVLKHPEVKQVHMVEIDERVTRVSEKFYPDLTESNNDPRAQLFFEDGIRWVERAREGSYDVIIVDGSDPEGPAAVLFSEEFFRHCHRVLAADGVMVGQSESPLFHLELIKHYHKTARGVGFKDVASLHFQQCTYPSGWWTVTVATKDQPVAKFREQDAEKRSFKTRYYTAAIHKAAMAQPAFVTEAFAK